MLPYFINRNSTSIAFNAFSLPTTYSVPSAYFSAYTQPIDFSQNLNETLMSLAPDPSLIVLTYTVPNQYIASPALSIGSPVYSNVVLSKYISYTVLIILILGIGFIVDFKYKKQINSLIKKGRMRVK